MIQPTPREQGRPVVSETSGAGLPASKPHLHPWPNMWPEEVISSSVPSFLVWRFRAPGAPSSSHADGVGWMSTCQVARKIGLSFTRATCQHTGSPRPPASDSPCYMPPDRLQDPHSPAASWLPCGQNLCFLVLGLCPDRSAFPRCSLSSSGGQSLVASF